MVVLEVADGTVRGNVSTFCKYPDGCTKVLSMCLSNNVLYISHQGNPDGVVGVEMSSLSADVLLRNGTVDCLACAILMHTTEVLCL